jgi:hypothetical protein
MLDHIQSTGSYSRIKTRDLELFCDHLRAHSHRCALRCHFAAAEQAVHLLGESRAELWRRVGPPDPPPSDEAPAAPPARRKASPTDRELVAIRLKMSRLNGRDRPAGREPRDSGFERPARWDGVGPRPAREALPPVRKPGITQVPANVPQIPAV